MADEDTRQAPVDAPEEAPGMGASALADNATEAAAAQPETPAQTPAAEPAGDLTIGTTDTPAEVPATTTPEPSATPSAQLNGPQAGSAGSPQAPPGFIRSLLLKAQEKIQSNKRKKLDKLMQFAQTKGKITNEDAQNLLRISDATATRYLEQLVKEGRLSQAGTRKGAHYQFIR